MSEKVRNVVNWENVEEEIPMVKVEINKIEITKVTESTIAKNQKWWTELR